MDNHRKTIDERLDALTTNVELLVGMQKDGLERSDRQDKQIAELALISAQHSQELRRFHRAMRAALEAYLSDEGEAQ